MAEGVHGDALAALDENVLMSPPVKPAGHALRMLQQQAVALHRALARHTTVLSGASHHSPASLRDLSRTLNLCMQVRRPSAVGRRCWGS